MHKLESIVELKQTLVRVRSNTTSKIDHFYINN